MDFWWRPYPTNITEALLNLTTIDCKPDVVVASFCSWHLGFKTDLEDWEGILESLRVAGQVSMAKRTTLPLSSVARAGPCLALHGGWVRGVS